VPDLPTVLRQHGVTLEQPGSDRHVRLGWLGHVCPWCAGSFGYHLGFNVEKGYFRCWRCGFHPTRDVIQKLCHVDRSTAIDILRSADGPNRGRNRRLDQLVQKRIGLHRYRRPSGVAPLAANHRSYLASRGFDPDRVAEEWGIEGTGPVSSLDGIDYRFRLFVPIHWDGTEVSFQTRDVTGKSDAKYVSCPPERELVTHKDVVYRHPDYGGRLGLAVEGVTDAWRLGPIAFATFGTSFKVEQVRAIAGLYSSVAVLFDAERAAQQRADRLVRMLGDVGVRATSFLLDGDDDPGSMSDDDAARAVEAVIEWDARG
jgi:hypothetical protein